MAGVMVYVPANSPATGRHPPPFTSVHLIHAICTSAGETDIKKKDFDIGIERLLK